MAHISVAAAKRASRKPAELTVVKATREARKIVNRVMPNVGVTVESKLSHDLTTDTPTVTTTITFPKSDARTVHALDSELYKLTGWWGSRKADSSIVVTRKVN